MQVIYMDQSWSKNGLSVKVLFSIPGVATQIVISTEESVDILLDCGSGVLRDLLFSYYPESKLINNISAILISHEHFDHVGGLYPLMDFMHMIGREKPLTLLVPKPSEVAKRFVEALKFFRKSKLTYQVNLIEVRDQDVIKIEPLTIKVFKVIHRGSTRTEPRGPLIPAVGYTIHYRDLKIVYSGDTGFIKTLEDEVENADLAILEATWPEDKGIDEIHLSEKEAIKIGERAKEYMLIHRLRDLKSMLK
ncbi:MAG: MBL fold metallo-hydrolase [archaeon GB-1867-035]|nr:MBL fold metallo-hydrolase [Candidatus Culexmicrobium profundum]